MPSFQQLIFIGIIAMLPLGCAYLPLSKNVNNIDISELEKYIEMSKGPCFGRCKVYSITVYENGVLTYEGKANTSKQGLYIRKIKDGEFKKMKDAIEATELERFKDAYRSNIPDLQSVSITYYGGKYIKSIVGKDGRPEEVLKVQAMLEDLVEAEDWQLYAKAADALPSYIVKDQVRVQLKENTDINAWVRKYRRQGMSIVRSMSDTSNFWLVEFDADRNDPREVLAIIQADLQVVSAEFNRR